MRCHAEHQAGTHGASEGGTQCLNIEVLPVFGGDTHVAAGLQRTAEGAGDFVVENRHTDAGTQRGNQIACAADGINLHGGASAKVGGFSLHVQAGGSQAAAEDVRCNPRVGQGQRKGAAYRGAGADYRVAGQVAAVQLVLRQQRRAAAGLHSAAAHARHGLVLADRTGAEPVAHAHTAVVVDLAGCRAVAQVLEFVLAGGFVEYVILVADGLDLVGLAVAVALRQRTIAVLVQLIERIDRLAFGADAHRARAEQQQAEAAADRAHATGGTRQGIEVDVAFAQGLEAERATGLQGAAVEQGAVGAVDHQYVGGAAHTNPTHLDGAGVVQDIETIEGLDAQAAELAARGAEVGLAGAGLGGGFDDTDCHRAADRYRATARAGHVEQHTGAVAGIDGDGPAAHRGPRPAGHGRRIQAGADPGARDALVVEGNQRAADSDATGCGRGGIG